MIWWVAAISMSRLPKIRAEPVWLRSGFASLEGAERNDCERVLDAGENLHFLIDEVTDVLLVVDIEFGEQIVIAGGRVDFRGNLGIGERAGNVVGFAQVALYLHEK